VAKKTDLNWFEKGILKVSPSWGASRARSRLEASMYSGAYEPTRSGKRPFENFLQFITSPNTRANYRERQKLVNFNRFLCMTGIGTAYTNRLTNHVIGNGIGFRAAVNAEYLGLGEDETLRKNQELTRLWKYFWNGENGHYERMYNGGYFQSLTFKSMLEGGDNFIHPARVKPRKNHRFPFALQSFESERVSTPNGNISDNRFVDGIERNDQGIPYRVHVTSSGKKSGQADPEYFTSGEWDSLNIFGPKTGIRQVFQLKNLAQDRPGAMRGIPFLTPATGLIIDHNELTESVLKAAKIQSIFAAIWKGGKGGKKFGGAPDDTKTAQTASKFPRIDLTGGQIVDMSGAEDYSLEPFESKQPNGNFTEFQMHILAVISAITGIPRSFVLMLFSQSYSAHKGELAVFWVTVLRYRYAYVFQFLFPFYEYLLTYAVANGLVSAPGYFNDPETRAAWLGDPIHQFTGPKMPHLDLAKEAKGLVELKNAKLKSTRGIIEETFTDDPEETFREIEEETERGIFTAVVKEMAKNEEEKDDSDDILDKDDE
jgi:capsid protein